MKTNINETIVEYNKVKKYFPNTYNHIMQYVNRPAGKEFFNTDSVPDLKTYIEFEGLFQVLFYLKENLRKGNKLMQILNTFQNRITKTEKNTTKSYLAFTDGYLYENSNLDYEFATDIYAESLVIVSAIKLYFEDKYNSRHAPIIALSKVRMLLERLLKKKDKFETPMTSYEYAEISLVKATLASINDCIVDYAEEQGINL